jgi:glycosyltransferase involved in cell wall biosynthesis
MPAFNHEAYVRVAVESVLGQTYPNLELIVIDDASTDGTWAVLESINDSRMQCFKHELNQGAHATLNEAMQMAKGEFIAILNSDDVFAETRIDRFLASASESGTPLFFAYSDVEFIDASGTHIKHDVRAMDYRSLCDRCTQLEAADWFLAGNPAISTSNFIFTRTLADKVGNFEDFRYTHDWDWALRASAHTAPRWIHEPLLAYRVHPANTLTEGDVWRHIHENSYIQAKALSQPMVSSDFVERRVSERFKALLGNPSFHPVPVLFYLLHELASTKDLPHPISPDITASTLRLLQSSSGLSETLFHSLNELAALDKVIQAQQQTIEERYLIIQQMNDEISHRDQVIASQATLADERYKTIQTMSEEIGKRDQVIEAQATLADERYQTIQAMSEEIDNRDQVIAAQATLVDERYQTIQAMSEEIGNRNREISDQRQLLDERWSAIEKMGSEIKNLQQELSRLNSNPWICVTRYFRNRHGK